MPRPHASRALGLVQTPGPAFPPPLVGYRAQLRGGCIRYRTDQMVFCEGDPADYIYLVLSGTIRCCRTLEDGRRQIVAFYLPGDLFGLNSGPEQRLSCEAVTEVLVMCLKRCALLAMARHDSRVADLLLAATTHELERLQEHFLVVTRSAQNRLAHFLIDLAGRMGDAHDLDLPMSRCEIADHLGLTVETVSRTLTELESTGVLERASPRHIIIKNPTALQNITA